jgi:Predicted Zn-dependent hydrolases of the beta-lactamase fold
MIKIQLWRHATCLITFNHKKILLDPMLSPAGTLEAIAGVPNPSKNPLTNLPDTVMMAELLSRLDAILITHTHRDHFDAAAMELLPKDIAVFCQPRDADKIKKAGFSKVNPVDSLFAFSEIAIERTTGKHGSGFIGHKMGPVSGFTLTAPGEPSLYITGDSIWCSKIKKELKLYRPQIIICFAGGAQFSKGGPITMTKADIAKLAHYAPDAQIVAVHMEAWNHCRLSRRELKAFLKEKSLEKRVFVPQNGDSLSFK